MRKILNFHDNGMSPSEFAPTIELAEGLVPHPSGYRLAGRFNSSVIETFTSIQASTLAAFTAVEYQTPYRIGDNPWVFFATSDFALHAFDLATTDSDTGPTLSVDFTFFCSYDEDVIATNINDDVQVITLSAVTPAWSTLISSTENPRSLFCARVGAHLVLAKVLRGTKIPSSEDTVCWSAADDPTDFEPSEITGADYQRITMTPGSITGLIGGSYGLIFKARAVYRMDPVGRPFVFTFSEISSEIGSPYNRSMVKAGSDVYFLSDRGPAVVRGGQQVQLLSSFFSLGDWVFGNNFLDTGLYGINSIRGEIVATYDRLNDLIFWDLSNEGVEKILCYSVKTDRFSFLDIADMESGIASSSLFRFVEVPAHLHNTLTTRGLPHLWALVKNGTDTVITDLNSNDTQAAKIVTGFFRVSENMSGHIKGARLLWKSDNRQVESGSSPFEVPYDITIKAGSNPISDAYTVSQQLSAPTNYNNEDVLPFNIHGEWFRIILDIPSYDRSSSDVEITALGGIELFFDEEPGVMT